MNEKFLPKYKFSIKKELLDKIKQVAALMELYEYRFDEDRQCTGYYAFKELVLLQEDLPKTVPKDKFDAIKMPGAYLLMKIHVNLREQALEYANIIRSNFKNKSNNAKESYNSRFSSDEAPLFRLSQRPP